MSLIDNIKDCFVTCQIPHEPTFRAVLFGESAVYFENVKSMVSYSQNEIILAVKDGGVKIYGNKLYVKKYCGGDLIICGKIKGIERM